MAIEPKTPRKRAVKKVSSKEVSAAPESDAADLKKATRKKSVPVPVFQAAPIKPVAASKARKKTDDGETASDASKKDGVTNKSVAAHDDGEDRGNRNKRRRRG